MQTPRHLLFLTIAFIESSKKARITEKCQSVSNEKKELQNHPVRCGETAEQSQLNHSCNAGECLLANLEET